MTLDLPQGAPRGPLVTLVFTDIEGSTPLWDAAPEAMRVGLALHDAVLRETLATHRGYEFRTEGDAFKVAFESPVDAVRWCLAVQGALMHQDWPTELLAQPSAADRTGPDGRVVLHGLRVRMGAHVGPVEVVAHPVTGRADFFGPMVNETARIAALPAGGQVAVSQAVWAVAGAELADVECRPLGAHRLRGVAQPVELLEVRFGDLDREHPPLRSTLVQKHNLPPATDAFVGRTRDLAAVRDALAQSRCVTLLGPGGTGKTRLSLEYARRRVGDFPGGAWFCDASECNTVADLTDAISSALSVPQGSVDDLGRALSRLGPVLLVLDNLEQLPARPTAAAVGTWMKCAPEVRLLQTSRHPIQVRGEFRLELPPLSVEDAQALLAERVEAVRGRPVTDQESEEAGALVEALDRMPLAIELAAARCDTMDLGTVRKRLNQRFRLLATRGDLPSRQATLRGAIDWSWDLLDPTERRAAAQCSVFAGGFDIAAAEQVLDLEDPDLWTVDVLQSLRQKSILNGRQDEAGRLRLGMYAAIREYAAEHLHDAEARVRHAAWASELAWGAVLGLNRPGELDRVATLHAERANFAEALRHTEDPGQRARLSLAMATSETLRGPGPSSTKIADLAVAHARAAGEPPPLCRALAARARLHRLAARPEPAKADIDEAVAIAREHGLDRDLGETLTATCLMFFYGLVDRPELEALLEEAGALTRRTGDRAFEAIVLAHYGYFEMDVDQMKAAAALARDAGAVLTAAWLDGFTWGALLEAGRVDEAMTISGSQLATFARTGNRAELAGTLVYAAPLHGLMGSPERGWELLADLEATIAPLDAEGVRAVARHGVPAVLELAEAHLTEDPAERARLLAQAEARVRTLRGPAADGGRPWAERSVPAGHLLKFVYEPARARWFGPRVETADNS